MILVVLAGAYVSGGSKLLPDPFEMMPVAWFGALGGVAINFHSLIRNAHKWQYRWDLWHLTRPLNSAIAGVVGYLIYLVVLSASTDIGPGVDPTIVSVVIAFVLGYREETFRDLLRRVTDVLASAGGGDVEPPSSPSGITYEIRMDGEKYEVFLKWGESTDNVGVAGYNVYRDAVFYAPVDLEQARNGFTDRQVEVGGVFRYLVTAVDAAGNESTGTGPIEVILPSIDGNS